MKTQESRAEAADKREADAANIERYKQELVDLVRELMYGNSSDMLQLSIDIANKLAEIDDVPFDHFSILKNRLVVAMQTMSLVNKVMGK